METAMKESRLLCHLLLLLRRLTVFLSLLPLRPLSPVAIKDLFLSLLLLLCGLSPRTVPVGGGATSLHLWSPRKRHQGRPSLVLIHGFGGFAKWQFERQIVPLSRRFDLYIPDLVFFGGSRSAGRRRSVEFQAECVAEAMRQLGVERYSVAGISYGGYVAFRLAAAEAAAEVERVVIMTSGLCATAEEMMQLAAREKRDVVDLLLPQRVEDLRNLFQRCMHRPPTWIPTFLLRDFMEMMFKEHRKERAELLKELLSNGVGFDPLPLLKQETLILWGDKDRVFPLSLAYGLQRHLGDKACRLQVIKEAGHALPLEKPQHVNNLIQRFLLQKNAPI